jgi:4'-phosphopantetheinyl transferase
LLSVQFSPETAPAPGGSPFPVQMSHNAAIACLEECAAGIDLYLVDLENYPWQSHHSWLSADENLRAERFRFEHDRRRFRAAHCAVREVLGSRLARHPASLKFRAGKEGKPSVVDCGCDTRLGFHFNLSHSADLAFIGIAPQLEIGVDIEQVREISELRPLAEQHFTNTELRDLLAEPEERQVRRFLHGWTRKEACLKAIGSGLSIAPSSFCVGLSDEPTTAVIETARGPVPVCVTTIELGPDAVAAMAWVDLQERIDFQDT